MNVDICITHNKGLGYSFNEGIRLAKNEMVLQIEDDWIPRQIIKSAEYGIHNIAYNILKKKKGIVRLYQDPIYTNVIGSHLGAKLCIDPHYHLEAIKANKNDMYKHLTNGYYYSNAPQFKLKSFVTDIGMYPESVPPPIVETDIAKKFLASDEYKIYYIVSIFHTISADVDSIRDIHLKKNNNNTNQKTIKDNISKGVTKYNYEYVYGFGNHHLPGKLTDFATRKTTLYPSPYTDVFTTLGFHKKVFSYDNLDYFRSIIKQRKNHFEDTDDNGKIYSISFSDRKLDKDENVNYFLNCIDGLEKMLKSNCSINFLYNTYKLYENDVSPSSDVTKSVIEDLYDIRKTIMCSFMCDKISMTIITFDENETYDNNNISYDIQPVEGYEGIIKVIIKCQFITHSNWYNLLQNNIITITNLYVDLHSVD